MNIPGSNSRPIAVITTTTLMPDPGEGRLGDRTEGGPRPAGRPKYQDVSLGPGPRNRRPACTYGTRFQVRLAFGPPTDWPGSANSFSAPDQWPGHAVPPPRSCMNRYQGAEVPDRPQSSVDLKNIQQVMLCAALAAMNWCTRKPDGRTNEDEHPEEIAQGGTRSAVGSRSPTQPNRPLRDPRHPEHQIRGESVHNVHTKKHKKGP